MYTLPEPQTADTEAFLDIKNDRVLLKYFQNVQRQFMQINNFGLALDDEGEIGTDKPIYLRSLFVPPYLSSEHLIPEKIINEENIKPSKNYQKISQLLKEEQRLFVLGDPGMGKTTLINWLMLAFAYSGNNLTKMILGELVPFVLVLRDLPLNLVRGWDDLWAVFLEENESTLTAIFKENSNSETIKKLFESGQALLLIDGLDEVTHEATRQYLGQAVLEGMNRYPRCKVMISSRIIGFNQQHWFGMSETSENFLDAELKILMKADDSLTLSSFYLTPFNYTQAQVFIGNWYQSHLHQKDTQHDKRVIELVGRIKQNDGLGRLARIPVLLNMICFIHARRGRLPDGRAELYQRIAETYLISLDKARGVKFKARELQFDYLDLCEWLGQIALSMQIKRTVKENAILISEADVKAILQEKLAERGFESLQIEAEIIFILDYLAQRSGLFVPRGKVEQNQEHYAFSHLSFLEFFAARALKQEVEIEGVAYLKDYRLQTTQDWWLETFVLFFEQLEHPRLVEKCLENLFLEKEEKEPSKALIKNYLLLVHIIMDSGVRLNQNKREEYLHRLWHFYLQICSDYNFDVNYTSFSMKLWQTRFKAIEIGIEEAKNEGIKRLFLLSHTIKDISPLAALTQLQKLDLSNTQISDISPLAALTQLQVLDLRNTQISDLSPLAALTQLQSLWLQNTKISDLFPLSALLKLKGLMLDKKFENKTQCLKQKDLKIHYL